MASTFMNYSIIIFQDYPGPGNQGKNPREAGTLFTSLAHNLQTLLALYSTFSQKITDTSLPTDMM